MWADGSIRIGRINPAVLTDLDDWILLQAYRGAKSSEIRGEVDRYLETIRKRQLMQLKKDKLEGNPLEEGKVEDRKRDFLRHLRPDQKHPVWNFTEDEPENVTPHVLNEYANPKIPYEEDCEKRVELTIENITTLAMHLKTYNKESWDTLVNYVVQIFIAQEKSEADEYAAWEET